MNRSRNSDDGDRLDSATREVESKRRREELLHMLRLVDLLNVARSQDIDAQLNPSTEVGDAQSMPEIEKPATVGAEAS